MSNLDEDKINWGCLYLDKEEGINKMLYFKAYRSLFIDNFINPGDIFENYFKKNNKKNKVVIIILVKLEEVNEFCDVYSYNKPNSKDFTDIGLDYIFWKRALKKALLFY